MSSAPPLKEEEQEARDRRASRKAAAACLARQRHKSFVHNLQDSVHAMRYRVEVHKSRRGQLGAVASAEMLRRLESELPADKQQQLRSWLKNSSLSTLAAAAPPVPSMPAALRAENAANAKAAADKDAAEAKEAGAGAPAASSSAAASSAAAAAHSPERPPRTGSLNVATPISAHKAGSNGSSSTSEATQGDADASRQFFLDQMREATATQRLPQGDQLCDDDYSHYDTPLGLTPAPLPLGLQSSLEHSRGRGRKVGCHPHFPPHPRLPPSASSASASTSAHASCMRPLALFPRSDARPRS